MAAVASPATPPSLVLFAREPVLGRVKTRLVPRLTEPNALRLYRAFLEDAARICAFEGRWTPVVAVEPDAGSAALAGLFPPPWRRESQGSGDLGERLTRAFERELARGAPAVLAVGSDHPTLSGERLAEAFDRLASGARAVAIPADDGGYCAIGFAAAAPYAEAFRDIPWSTSDVLPATRARLAARGVELVLLAPAYDVDRPEDLDRLRRELAGADSSARDYPRETARVIEELP